MNKFFKLLLGNNILLACVKQKQIKVLMCSNISQSEKVVVDNNCTNEFHICIIKVIKIFVKYALKTFWSFTATQIIFAIKFSLGFTSGMFLSKFISIRKCVMRLAQIIQFLVCPEFWENKDTVNTTPPPSWKQIQWNCAF